MFPWHVFRYRANFAYKNLSLNCWMVCLLGKNGKFYPSRLLNHAFASFWSISIAVAKDKLKAPNCNYTQTHTPIHIYTWYLLSSHHSVVTESWKGDKYHRSRPFEGVKSSAAILPNAWPMQYYVWNRDRQFKIAFCIFTNLCALSIRIVLFLLRLVRDKTC